MEYTVNDELDFVSWIASNGETDRDGRVLSEEEIETNGKPQIRNCIQRMDFLREYSHQWKNRGLPDGWCDNDRQFVRGYIESVAIPTVELMRSLMMGEVI